MKMATLGIFKHGLQAIVVVLQLLVSEGHHARHTAYMSSALILDINLNLTRVLFRDLIY